MSAPAERTVLKPRRKWSDGDPVVQEITFSHGFDPKATAEADAKEIVWKYEDEIRKAISQ